jgi:hypothetical protein
VPLIGVAYYLEFKDNYSFWGLVLFASFLIPFSLHTFILFKTLGQANKIRDASIALIVPPDSMFAQEALFIDNDNLFGSNFGECPDDNKCVEIDVEHRLKFHTTPDSTLSNAHPFQLEFDMNTEYNDFSKNIIIGFHQTKADSVPLILKTEFKPGKSGMLGAGIYFATCRESTEFKALSKGCYFCAKISLGRVLVDIYLFNHLIVEKGEGLLI